MRQNNLLVASGMLLVAGCGAAQRPAAQLAGANCAGLADAERQVAELYTPSSLGRVEPLYRDEFKARAIQSRYVAGAKLQVAAQPGMSQPYLERVLSCHAAAPATLHPNDPLQASRLKDVDVASSGQHFVISIEGADREAGRDIWQRALALRGQATQVEVRQLSLSASDPSKL